MAAAFNETALLEEDIAVPRAHMRGAGLGALLPRVSKGEAHGARTLCDTRLEALAARIAGVASWTLAAFGADDVYQEPGRIVLAHVAGALAIDIDLQRYPALRILVSASGAQSLRQSIAAALLAPLTDSMTAAGAGSWRVSEFARIEPEDIMADAFTAQLSLTFQGRRHDARLHASPAVLAMFERRIGELYAFDTAQGPLINIPGSVVIGARRISIAALEALRPGDVMLRTMSSHTEAALREGHAFAVRAAWGTHGLTQLTVKAELSDGCLAIIEDPIMTDDLKPLDDTGPQPDLHGDFIEIGALELPVQFELDSVALPLAQLSSLRPGYVIELETPVAEAQIRLVAHGQTIGYGELISVAEHLGIRIVKMAHGDGPVR